MVSMDSPILRGESSSATVCAMNCWTMTYWMLADDGETPIPTTDVLRWGAWFQTADRVVRQDFWEGQPVQTGVSTVFLGLDHDFLCTGRPVLWESLVYGTSLDGQITRYRSRADALAGHASLLAAVTAQLKVDR